MAIRTDCISWNKELKRCNALENGSTCDMFDKDCPFFKTLEEQIEIEEKCKWRCIRKDYVWRGRFIK